MTTEQQKHTFLLLCPTCKTEVKETGKDDIQTWYTCEAGHKTAAPIKQEIDALTHVQLKVIDWLEKHPNYHSPIPNLSRLAKDRAKRLRAQKLIEVKQQ